MPGKAIGIALDLGYPGSFSRNGDFVASTRPVAQNATEQIEFGDLVALNPDNTVSKLPTGETNANKILGVAVREVKQFSAVGQAVGHYRKGEPCDVLERGTVAVLCTAGTPVAGGKVYFNPGTRVITAESAGNVEIPFMSFTTGKKDANGIVEVTIKTRNI